MTRKHFTQLADILKQARMDERNEQHTIDRLESELMVMCKEQNNAFDAQRFVQASTP